MTLPGKIVFCQLEEDNPQKSFFRIKPLCIVGHEGLSLLENGKETWPDEGGIRIVPDKNEATLFRGRMRTMGGYCLLDLTRHTGENDKIRPNKNYSAERGELNRNIVYSDVITACPETEVMQVTSPVSANESLRLAVDTELYTRLVLTRGENGISGPFTWEKDETGITLTPSEKTVDIDESKIVTFDRDGKEVSLLVACRAPAPAEAPAPAAEKPAEKAEEPAAEPAPAPVPAPERAEKREAPKPAPKSADKPFEKPAPERPAESFAQRRKAERELIGQLGLNPRRSKGLCELVDDGWKHTRLEQLGATVPGDVQSKPVVSPVEQAEKALDEAWRLEDGRASLVNHLLGMDMMPEAVKAALGVKPEKQVRDEKMDELEAERLQLLREIDNLRGSKADVRGELLQETIQLHSDRINELTEREKTLKDECEALTRAAQTARTARKEAESLLNKDAREKLDGDFLKFAMFSRAAALLRDEPDADCGDFLGSPKTCRPTGAQMVSDLRRSFEDAGMELEHDDALNLLTCLAIGGIVIFSGPTGCGKTSLARALANALGLTAPGASRFAVLNTAERDVRRTHLYRGLLEAQSDTMRIALMDDVNTAPSFDQSRGLMSVSDNRPEGLTVIMTVQDDQIGFPVDCRLLDRAFFIRLKRPADTKWKRRKEVAVSSAAAELDTVKKIFRPDTEVPAELVSRFETLCARLNALGTGFTPRAMDEMYAYCAAFVPLMSGEPISALDRAVAQRGLPYILATAKADVIRRLPALLCDMPISLSLLNEPLPLPPM